jgi:hypothetical protein
MTRKVCALICVGILLLILLSCSTNVADGGSGSEVTNGVVLTANGLPAQNVRIAAYPDSFSSDTYYVENSDTTDANGCFSLKQDTGLFNIFVIDSLSNTGVCVPFVAITDIPDTIRLDTLGAIIVQPCALLHDSVCEKVTRVFIPGSPISKRIVPGLSFSVNLEYVPSGNYKILFESSLDGAGPGPFPPTLILGETFVTITSGDTASLE